MPQVFVSIGSNIERERHIRSALEELRRHFGRLIVSNVYESKPVGFVGGNFFNLAVGFKTDESLWAVRGCLRSIEILHSRDRHTSRFSSRTLDLDLLLYGDLITEEQGIKLPREEIIRYAFVLGPLAEIAGEMCHPQLKVSFATLWRSFDKSRQPTWRVDLDVG